MILQKEKLSDYWEVENLYDLCFTHSRLSLSAYRLRENVKPIEELCYIARDETNNIFAAVRYWPIKIESCKFLLLGPMGVHPTRQGEGHARFIINNTLERAEALGWRAVILIGDLHYYKKFNFKVANKLIFPPPTNKKRILIKSLNGFAVETISGIVKKY